MRLEFITRSQLRSIGFLRGTDWRAANPKRKNYFQSFHWKFNTHRKNVPYFDSTQNKLLWSFCHYQLMTLFQHYCQKVLTSFKHIFRISCLTIHILLKMSYYITIRRILHDKYGNHSYHSNRAIDLLWELSITEIRALNKLVKLKVGQIKLELWKLERDIFKLFNLTTKACCLFYRFLVLIPNDDDSIVVQITIKFLK